MSIVNIYSSDNSFSGGIPAELFLLLALYTIALTKKCFTGTLPSSMCNAVRVIVFSMDGLGSAGDWKYTFSLGNTVHCNIPECLMLLVNMTVLSLSANYLTGAIGCGDSCLDLGFVKYVWNFVIVPAIVFYGGS